MKFEKLSNKKFEQVNNSEMKNIVGGTETSWRDNGDGTTTWDTFDYWSRRDGTPYWDGPIMDGFVLGPTLPNNPTT